MPRGDEAPVVRSPGYAAAKGLIVDGKVKPIAVTSAKRASFAADIPAIAEYAPLAGYRLENGFGLFASALQAQGGKIAPMSLE